MTVNRNDSKWLEDSKSELEDSKQLDMTVNGQRTVNGYI